MIFGVGPSVVLLFASSILAAPTSAVAPSRAISSSHPSRKSSQPFPTHSHRPSVTVYPLTIGPQPPASSPPAPKQHESESQRERAQRNAAIAIGAVAGTVILGFLIAILRCIFNYKRPPKRDRIAEILQRHNLQCEMEELERNPYALRRPSLREPAPPYFPRPPSYSNSVTESLHRDGNTSAISTEHSRNDSTSSSTRHLLPNSPSTLHFSITR